MYSKSARKIRGEKKGEKKQKRFGDEQAYILWASNPGPAILFYSELSVVPLRHLSVNRMVGAD